ncbi:hypothetical protein BG015_011975 [Linnemannia schmuckeri]|uniref:F-box domain-containing protein n=1 Tax=Linnemannia schmuckeri TaxID=64567 RepID=A0A9P5S4N8_9FUNG|nr:hypothetical protein BG015_011975 [Linnemannia schmuckeri]
MQPFASNTPKNPLNLSEIRVRVASFLDRKDCLSCMRVSQDWLHDFAPSVWHTIDFYKVNTSFLKISPEVLDKYGRFISKILNLSAIEHFQALQHFKVDSVRSMTILLPNNWIYREMLSDLLLRCRGFIYSLDIRSSPPSPDTLEEQRRWAVHYMHVNDLFANVPRSTDGISTANKGGCLTTLKLTRICVTREAFSSLLQYSPLLNELSLERVMVLFHKPGIPLYTGSMLRHLSADFAQVWSNDTLDPSAPCLLLHFPLLERWHMTSLTQPSYRTVDLNILDFSSWCPLLKAVTYGSNNTETLSALLLNAFKDLKSCSLSAKNLAMSTALGLISHLDSLTSLTVTDAILNAASMQWLFLILRLCRNLQILSIESIVCDLKTVEKSRWGCKGLRELRVRFKDLDTPQDIDGCFKQLCELRRFGNGPSLKWPNEMNSISTRVAHQLAQLKELRAVWLGTKDYYLPPLSA